MASSHGFSKEKPSFVFPFFSLCITIFLAMFVDAGGFLQSNYREKSSITRLKLVDEYQAFLRLLLLILLLSALDPCINYTNQGCLTCTSKDDCAYCPSTGGCFKKGSRYSCPETAKTTNECRECFPPFSFFLPQVLTETTNVEQVVSNTKVVEIARGVVIALGVKAILLVGLWVKTMTARIDETIWKNVSLLLSCFFFVFFFFRSFFLLFPLLHFFLSTYLENV
jgi:hypothetical protein